MRFLFDKLFTSYLVFWLFVHLCRRLELQIPVVNDYLTDLIFVPFTAHLTRSILRFIAVNKYGDFYPLWYVLSIALYASIVFEWLLPQYSAVYTADLGDVSCYFTGALFYYFVHQKYHAKFMMLKK